MHFSGRPVALRRLPRLTIAPNLKKPPLTAQRFLHDISGLILHYLECWRVNAADFRGSDGSYSSTRLPDKCIPTLNITYITTDAQ